MSEDFQEEYLDIPPYYAQIGQVDTHKVLLGDLVVGFDQNPPEAQEIDPPKFSSGYVILPGTDDGHPDNRSKYYDPVLQAIRPASGYMHLYRRQPNFNLDLDETLLTSTYTRPINLPDSYRIIHLSSPENVQSGDYLRGKLSALSQNPRYIDEMISGLVIRTTERSPPLVFNPAMDTARNLYAILNASEGERRTHDFIVDVYRPDRWLAYTAKQISIAMNPRPLTVCKRCQVVKQEYDCKCYICHRPFCCYDSFRSACISGEHKDPCRIKVNK